MGEINNLQLMGSEPLILEIKFQKHKQKCFPQFVFSSLKKE